MNDFHKQQPEDGSLPKSHMPKQTKTALLTWSVDEIKDREGPTCSDHSQNNQFQVLLGNMGHLSA